MNRGTEYVEGTPQGFAFLCDCGTTINVLLDADGPIQDGHELAVTCEGCKSSHWFTLNAIRADPR